MTKTKTSMGQIAFICICAIMTILTFSFANLLSSLLIKSTIISANTIKNNEFTIYFLSFDKFSNQSDAQECARNMYYQNIGGYTLEYNGLYYVIASGYKNGNDANLVKNNLSSNGTITEILEITFASVLLSGDYSNEEKNVLESCLCSFYKAYESLYDIVISLDTNVISETSARLSCNDVLTSFSNNLQNFTSLLGENYKSSILSLSKSLNNAKTCLTNLCNNKKIDSTQTFSSLIKYRYTELLDIYRNLTLSLDY